MKEGVLDPREFISTNVLIDIKGTFDPAKDSPDKAGLLQCL